MKNLKWWQWCLIIFIGIPMIGATIDVVTGSESDTKTDGKTHQQADIEFRALSGNVVFAMTFEPITGPETLPDLAREHCGARDFCNVIGWTDPNFAAKGFPMTDRETSHVKFQYTVNRDTGYERSLWDCRIWKKNDDGSCLSFD